MRIGNAAMLMLFLGTPVLAQTSVGELTRLNDDTVMLKARLAKAQAEASLRKARDEARPDSAQPDQGMPVVTGVFGRDGNVYAQFLYAGGTMVPGTVGETLPGGFLVSAVSVEQVVLSKAGERIRVGFSGTPQRRESPSADGDSPTKAIVSAPGKATPSTEAVGDER